MVEGYSEQKHQYHPDGQVLEKADFRVANFGHLLERNSLILDVGAGSGRNGIYLASMGHNVISLEKFLPPAQKGHKAEKEYGENFKHQFVIGDMTQLPFEMDPRFMEVWFDAVISVVALHELESKASALEVISNMQVLTKDGGYNLVEVFLDTPINQLTKDQYAMFEPTELKEFYAQSGWEIIVSEIKERKSHPDKTGNMLITSSSAVIARKPNPVPAVDRAYIMRQVNYLGRTARVYRG